MNPIRLLVSWLFCEELLYVPFFNSFPKKLCDTHGCWLAIIGSFAQFFHANHLTMNRLISFRGFCFFQRQES
jgi:hypothetical protein